MQSALQVLLCVALGLITIIVMLILILRCMENRIFYHPKKRLKHTALHTAPVLDESDNAIY